MSRLIKRFQRVKINRQIAHNRDRIESHRAVHPDDFAGREQFYMNDHALRRQRDEL
jgi:hypothetical protein